jgi:hypothetical protein
MSISTTLNADVKRGTKDMMEIDGDILEVLKDVPECMNDLTVTTEFKFLTLGAILVQCSDEIRRLRIENERLRSASPRTKKSKKM